MTAMSTTTRARWFDPTSGNYTTISGSPFPATGTRSFAPPGANSAGQGDWVLVLDLSGVVDTTAPSTPTNLAATTASASQVNLNWTAASDNVGVTGYKIFRGGAQVGTAPTTVYSDTGLLSNTSYTYTVSAYDAANNSSGVSQPASATTSAPDTTPPSTPTNLAGSNITSSSARITWTASTDNVSVAGYRVMRNGSLIGTSAQPSYDDSGLNPSTTYTYAVAAYDASNNVSATSSGVNVTTSPGSSGTITFVQLKENRLTANSISLNTGTFGSPVGAGHLMVVWIWYASAARSVAKVTDTLGNVYARVVGPTTGTGGLAQQRQELWYAKNLAAGATSVTATFDAAVNADMSISAHEYAGADPATPLDATSTVAVSGTNVSGSPVTTTAPSELIFGATLFQGTGAAGAGFTKRSSIANNVSEDKVVTTAGSYSVSFVNVSQAAIVQTATFRAAAQQPVGQTITVMPRTSVLTPTLQQQFTASGGSVAWTVDGIAGGSAATGTISAAGLYTPPSTAGTHTVTGTDQGQSASATVHVTTYPGSFTHHNDNSRTGQNTSETVLTPSNVGPNTFGKLFSYSLDGPALASPLYVAGVTIPGQGVHNVAYVATEHDSVYAFDADGLVAAPLWRRNFLGTGVTPVPSNDTGDGGAIGPEIGITGTPVIDPSTQTLYVVAKTKEGSNYVQRLHALDLGTGAEKFSGPVVIQASVPGSGAGSSLGQVAFDALHQNQRAALLLSNGVVYIAFGSHGDQQAYHGWLLGYRASTLQQVMVVNVNPNAAGAGIWQANGGPAADAAGSLYITTGNGNFNANSGGSDFGDSFLKLTPGGTIADYFTPWNQGALNANDFDLGAAGPLLLPDQTGAHPHLLLSAGKNNTIYLVDRDAMGHYSGTTNDNQIVQSLVDVFPNGTPEPGNYSAPVYFNGTIYFGPVADRIQSFPLSGGRLATTAQSRSAESFPYPGATMSVSAAGTSNGILWAIQRNGDCGVPGTCGTTAPAVLKAYDATNLGTPLFSSDQFGERDTLDAAAKFSVPLVANGKVFVTSMGMLSVYGLLP
jgi:chitodextrinase